jgi:hypothetical protein
MRALAQADRPLRAREIHQTAQELAGTPLSWNTVKDCLHKHLADLIARSCASAMAATGISMIPNQGRRRPCVENGP